MFDTDPRLYFRTPAEASAGKAAGSGRRKTDRAWWKSTMQTMGGKGERGAIVQA